MLPDVTDVCTIFTVRTLFRVNTFAVIAVHLAIIWVLQAACVFQTRRWVAREVEKRFNSWYVGLTSVVIWVSVLTCITVYLLLYYGSPTPLISDSGVVLSPILLFVHIYEKKRLFTPREISEKDDFRLPDDFHSLYIERDWRFEWVFLLKCISLLPFVVLSAMRAIPGIMWLPGLLSFVLLSKIIPPDAVEWQVDSYLICYKHKKGDRTVARRDWHISSINFVEALDFDPETDFDDNEPRNGISEVFEGVQGYFGHKCRRGVVIGTQTGEFYLLGFMRPNYAAAMVEKYIDSGDDSHIG